MKTFQLNAEARTDLGKKAAKALRKENKIPVVLNGGKLVELDKDGNYNGKLLAGEKVVPIGRDGKGTQIQELLQTRADYQARLNLLPYGRDHGIHESEMHQIVLMLYVHVN